MDLLKHGLSIYTIEAYNIFEQEFIDGASYNYEEVHGNILGRIFEYGFQVNKSSITLSYTIKHKE